MPQMTWPQAVAALLSFFKIQVGETVQTPSLVSLKHVLKGTGVEAKAMRGADTVLGADFDAAILARRDGSFVVMAYDNGQAVILGADGAMDRSATQSDMDDVKTGWIIRKKDPVRDDILAFYRRYKRLVLQIMACGFVVNLFALCLPIFASFVYDKVLGNNIHETLWALVIGLVLIAAVDFSIRAIRILLAEQFAQASEADIDHHVFQGLLGADTQSLPSMGRFLDRYKRILSSRDLLSSTYLLSLVDIPFLLLFVLVIAAVAGPLVFIPVVFGLLMMLANYATFFPSLNYEQKSRQSDEQRFRLMTDVIASHEAVVGSHWGTALASRWRAACTNTSSCLSLSRYWKSLGGAITNSMSFLSYVFVIVGGAYMVDERTLTSGGLLAASMLSSRVTASFSSFITIVMRYKDFKSSLKEMNAILHAPKLDAGKSLPHALKGAIVFNNVSCTLGQNKNPVLSNINLKISHGEVVGIAGIPGSGKTTLLRLVNGLVKPKNGEVLIDHYPVSSFSPSDLARAIGYKPQDLCLLEGTIESNVCAGAPPLTLQQRDHVLSASGLGWLFQQGALNWSTEVGPRGTMLSGGQRQLVALARAVMGERPILLLDEPTNGLDVQLEAHLAKYLASLKGRCTVLICTHSRHLLSACDRIIAVGDGRILADGPRDKILVA